MIILFDIDGTLLDSTEGILDGFYAAFDTFGFPRPSRDKITELIGYPLEVMFENLGVSPKKSSDFVAAYKERYRQIYLQKTTIIDGNYEALKLASEFASLGVVTTKTSRFTKILLENLGLMSFFKTIVGRDDVNEPKPAAEPILLAISKILNINFNDAKDAIKKEKIYMIGDTKLDLIAAKNAGVTGIGVLCGYGKDLQNYTNLVFKNPLEAVDFLSR